MEEILKKAEEEGIERAVQSVTGGDQQQGGHPMMVEDTGEQVANHTRWAISAEDPASCWLLTMRVSSGTKKPTKLNRGHRQRRMRLLRLETRLPMNPANNRTLLLRRKPRVRRWRMFPKRCWAMVSMQSFRITHGGDLSDAIAVQDPALKNLMMAWYFAGYYTGLYEGQRLREQQQQQQR